MKLYISFIVAILISINSTLFASVEISNPRAIMDASLLIKSNQRPDFRARLSPDGKYLLFPQQNDVVEETYTLFLQDVETADEIRLPVVLLSGYESVFTRFNFFNPTGDKLSLVSMKKENNQNLTEVIIFDIASKKSIKTGINGHLTMAQFDSSGNNIVLSLDERTVAMASLDDFKPDKPIMSGWVHSCCPKTPYATVFVPPIRRPMSIEELRNARPKSEFRLLNLETNESSLLPVHNENDGLDDITSHWSSDGLFMFYVDLKENSLGNLERITRVWDVNSNIEKAVIPNVMCLGPGPANNLMIMISTENNNTGSNLRLYEIKTGGLSTIGDGLIKGIHAWNNRVVYLKEENGVGTIFAADLAEFDDRFE